MANIIAGLIAIALGILTFILWPWRVLELIQGMLPIALIGIGVIAIVAGMELAKEKNARSLNEAEAAEETK